MCVSEEGRAEEEAEEEPGIENQKQEPHTKLWRKTRNPTQSCGEQNKKQNNENTKKKQEKQNDKTQLSATTTPPCGVQSCFFVFFCFFGFLVSCFLVQVAP